jgi:hypothetical protein
MVEIGKRDLIGQGELQMAPFERNRTFAGLDLSEICVKRPSMINR